MHCGKEWEGIMRTVRKRRGLAVLLAICMLTGVIPVSQLGGVLRARAATAYTAAELSMKEYSQSGWETSSNPDYSMQRTTTWSFLNPETARTSTKKFADGDVIDGLIISSIGDGTSLNTGGYLSAKKATLLLPLSENTVAVQLSYNAATNSKRTVTVGDNVTDTFTMNKEDEDPKTVTKLYTKADGYFSTNALKLVMGTNTEGDSGEAKTNYITITEYTNASDTGGSDSADTLAEMSVGTPAESYDFKANKQVFGQADVSEATVYSVNQYIKLGKGDNDTLEAVTNGHGLTFTAPVVFETIVPAETMGVFTFSGCQYASCSAVMTVGGNASESVSLKTAAEDGAVPFTYQNTTGAAVRMQITVTPSSRGYVHGVSYEVQEIPAKSWAANKTGTVTIGDTAFTVASGATEGSTFAVAAASGSGSVEIGNHEKAVVWTNLSGKTLTNAVSAGEGISAVTVKDNKVTLTYSDTSSLPESYVLEVRDSGKAVEPEQDGKTITYDLTNGRILSELHTGKLADGTNIPAEDGLFVLQSAGGMYYHGSPYGIVVNANDSIAVKVAGDAKVSFTTASFGTTGIQAAADKGTVYVSADETKAQTAADTSNQDPGTFTFLYEGEAAILTFTFTGATSYVRTATVTNAAPPAPEGGVHPEAVTVAPSVINWDKGQLSVSVVGQQITLSNPTKVPATNIRTSGLGMYVFPLTSDNNTLSVDMVLGECEASTSNAVMMGLFNESVAGDDNGIRAITTGIRNSNHEVVQLMSKAENKDILGKNSFNGVASPNAGDVITVTITRDGSNVIQTVTNKTQRTETISKKTAYGSCKSFLNPGGEVYYGLMVANEDVTITNMVYTDANGKVLYDQNAYYDPVGDVPVAETVTAAAASDRTKITVEWTGTEAKYDAKYVLQVKKPNSDTWEDVETELTVRSYDYAVSSDASGEYKFRVCGTRGNSAAQNVSNRNAWVESNAATIDAALATPALSLSHISAADKVVLSWTESAGASSYEIYRRYDDKQAELIATVSDTSYTDTTVSAEVPYYYSVAAIAANNFSPVSEEKWTLTTNGHSGDYDENVALYVTKRSYNTVFENKIDLEGIAGAPGTVSVYVNDVEKASQTIAAANETFSFGDVEIGEGRNEVELVLEYGKGLKVRKSLNYVYLTNYDYVVDDDFDGTDGTADANGVPQYRTVAAAIAAIPSGNSSAKVILIRNGDYHEKLNISTPYVSLIGEDSVNTRIYYAVCEGTKAQEADGSRYATTITKTAAGFTAENLTFENAWEYVGDGVISNESAEAVYCEAANALFVGVRMLSYQDTIQSKDNAMYLLRCYIAGNVDYMWGQRTKVLFEDCDFEFRYNANKNSGYYTAYGPDSQVIYNNCRFYAEANCGGSKYYLGRPYNNATAVAFIDCYMGSILNKEWGYATWGGKELSTDAASYEATEYYECGTYGAGYAVNINRRQISHTAAAQMLSTAGLGWDPFTMTSTLGSKYVGTLQTEVNTGAATSEYNSTKYSPYEGDDTGLGQYNLEGFAESAETTGGGLLKETDANYYKVATGDEFLQALTTIRAKGGVPSVIEITGDSISLGINEIDPAYATKYGSNIVAPHNPALVSPVLKESGVSKVYIKQMSNLTIFSKNGATIKHGAFNISNSSNIIIRNVDFDELWEWDEGDAESKAGDYDVNDWDYMTIENGSSRVWIDHCSFYKAYDGVIDIKTSDAYATPMYITVSWCEFRPGSENNTFFNEMMDYLDKNQDSMPYYKSLLDSGMTKEQIWWYAYGQKKTHLLGQSDDAAANVNLNVTFANNYYYNSMDRMPRLRYGTAHVYNCIMDAQELLNAKKTIANTDAAKHIVSNGAASTCDGEVLLENCFINGIQNALNSGNGSSPSGYIAAVDTLYYVDGVRYAPTPKVNTTKEGEALKLTDAAAFRGSLPYSDYILYDAAELDTLVKPYAGASKLNLTTLQWEKGIYYDASFQKPADNKDYDADTENLPTYQIPTTDSTPAPTVTPTPAPTETPKEDNRNDANTADDDDDDGDDAAAAVSPTATPQPVAPTKSPSGKPAATVKPSGTETVKKLSVNRVEDWDEVDENLEELIKKAGGSKVVLEVELGKYQTLTREIAAVIQGKNVTLRMEQSNGIIWEINGLDVEKPGDVSMLVTLDSKAVPEEKLKIFEGLGELAQMSLEHEGDFGFKAIMKYPAGKKNNDQYANLFYYNDGAFEFVDSSKVKGGVAEFVFTHASDYVVVLTETALTAVPEAQAGDGTSADKTDTTDSSFIPVETVTDTKDGSGALSIILIIVAVAAAGAIVIGVTVSRKKKVE